MSESAKSSHPSKKCVPFDKFLGTVLLAIACPSVSGGAYPNSVSSKSPVVPSKYATGSRSKIVARRNSYLNAFHPPTTFRTFGEGIYHVPPPEPATFQEMATTIVESQININSTDIQSQSGFAEGPGAFAYFRQTHEGVPFANAVANLALHKNRVVAFGSSFVEIRNIHHSVPTRDVQAVIPLAERILNGKFNGHATLEYYVEWNGFIALTHVVQVQNDDKETWFEAFMDAHNGDFIAATDFVAKASYKVVPISQRDLRHGGQVTLVDPQGASSSPMGWHDNGATTTTSTDGNNVIAFKTKVNFWTRRNQTVTTPETRAGLIFNYTYVDTWDPKLGKNNVDAARTNAFYVINTMHDIAYKYGFTEKSFNFQTNNFGKGGLGNDRIRVQVQDSGGNSARFHTPPDGQSGICQLWVMSKTLPRRDVAMDNGMIIHEFTHGITRRMVGGGTARCLGRSEALELGEGWSDAMAEYPIPPGSESPLPDYLIGQYFTGRAAGLRTYPYSISNATNKLRYSSIKHLLIKQIGEVWANMLHNVYATLVEEHRFSENAKTDATTSEGNVVFMHLFIDALSLLPCDPTFLHVRDAWIQADQVRYVGINKCLLWKAFSSRGLGVKAADSVDDSSVPHDCISKANVGSTGCESDGFLRLRS
ncbi:Fungalysin metallopeptidase-domain-containing protein [Infundibulicybe gibba]|nr:Fungalysin metallopeptidase-domain-containing protein [Infundibulicybe gibba]